MENDSNNEPNPVTVNWGPRGSIVNWQGMVVDEDTGRDVAAVYNKKDAPLLAAAPRLFRSLKKCLPVWESGIKEPWIREAQELLAELEEQQEQYAKRK